MNNVDPVEIPSYLYLDSFVFRGRDMAGGESNNDILQGTMTMLVLRILDADRLHGYAISQRIHRVSGDLLRVEEGSLYPALRRMEQQGWISAEWGMTETNRRARFYALTKAGQDRLKAEKHAWQRLTAGVSLVMQNA